MVVVLLRKRCVSSITPATETAYLDALSCKLRKRAGAPACDAWRGEAGDLTSSWARNGPEVPRLRLRPVRLGTVTLSSRLLVATGVESKRLASGSSGRSETEMTLGRAFSPLAPGCGSSLALKPWRPCQLQPRGDGDGDAGLEPTLLSLRDPPSERMPLSTFLTRHGCSTTDTAREGICSHGAACSGAVLCVSGASLRSMVRPLALTLLRAREGRIQVHGRGFFFCSDPG